MPAVVRVLHVSYTWTHKAREALKAAIFNYFSIVIYSSLTSSREERIPHSLEMNCRTDVGQSERGKLSEDMWLVQPLRNPTNDGSWEIA